MSFSPLRTSLALAIALLAAGCATTTIREPRPMASQGNLEGIDWRLASAATGAGAATLRFEGERFSMRGPCNQHTGTWRRDGDRLVFGAQGGAVASTRMMCPPPVMAREAALTAAMQQPMGWRLDGSFLLLEAADGSTWRFDSRDLPPPEGRERIVQVAGQRSPCTGVAPMLCLQVRTQPGAPWQLHYGDIEGFDWQSGVEYVIRVRELPVANPPADGSSLRWVLEEILERDPPR